MKKQISVAIDGPSGAGKSTIARMLAERCGLVYIDTGAIYRSVGLYALRREVDPKDAAGVEAILPELALALMHNAAGEQRVLLNGEDVSEQIRTPQISQYASDVSAIAAVRAFLLEMQREFARRYCVVMDGRDIGTVVLPDASLKIFLTASLEERAGRRHRELQEKGHVVELAQVMEDMRCRDANDTGRAVAPLTAAPDAVHVDTTDMDLDTVLKKLETLVKEKLRHEMAL